MLEAFSLSDTITDAIASGSDIGSMSVLRSAEGHRYQPMVNATLLRVMQALSAGSTLGQSEMITQAKDIVTSLGVLALDNVHPLKQELADVMMTGFTTSRRERR